METPLFFTSPRYTLATRREEERIFTPRFETTTKSMKNRESINRESGESSFYARSREAPTTGRFWFSDPRDNDEFRCVSSSPWEKEKKISNESIRIFNERNFLHRASFLFIYVVSFNLLAPRWKNDSLEEEGCRWLRWWILREWILTFYHAKLQFDAGGRSLESLLNTRRRSNVCVPTGRKNSIRSLSAGGNINVRSKTARCPARQSNPVLSNPISIELSRPFSFSTRWIDLEKSNDFCTNSTFVVVSLEKKKERKKSFCGIHFCFGKLANRSRVYRALDRIPAQKLRRIYRRGDA